MAFRLDARYTFASPAFFLPNCIFMPTPKHLRNTPFLLSTGWSTRILEFWNVRVGMDLKIILLNLLDSVPGNGGSRRLLCSTVVKP